MPILKEELRKMAFVPMMWVFLAICLMLNIGMIFLYRQKIVEYSYFSYVGDTASVTGNMLGKEFSERLWAMPASPEKRRLVSETGNATSIYKDYDAKALGDAYIGLYGMEGTGAQLLTAKYQRLQSAVERLDQAGAEFSLYGAGATVQMHHLLFGVVMRAAITECCVLAALIMLYLCGYEYQNRTEAAVYTTKVGRRVYKYKFAAGMLAAAASFAGITGGTLFVYFRVFDYSKLWDCSVSSGFNYISGMIGVKPFLTWVPFTIRGYLAAMAGAGLVLTLIFALMGALIGFLSRNAYVGVLLFFLLDLAMMAMPYLFSKAGIWSWYFLLQFSPVRLWFVQPEWFTDLGSVSVIPFHETAGILFNVLFWGSLLFLAWQYVKRKDVA